MSMRESSFHPSMGAGLMLSGRELGPTSDAWPTATRASALTGADETDAYESLSRLREMMPTVLRKSGCPACPAFPTHDIVGVARAVYDDLALHPGAAWVTEERSTFTHDFLRFVVGLTAPGQPREGMSPEELAMASVVPLDTLGKCPRNTAPKPTRHEPLGRATATARTLHSSALTKPTRHEPMGSATEGMTFRLPRRTTHLLPHGLVRSETEGARGRPSHG